MFRVSARTVIQLGAELISSDAVAFYELIKNAFDAGSKRVTVRVVERLPFAAAGELRQSLAAAVGLPARDKTVQEAVRAAQERVSELAVKAAPDAEDFLERAAAAKSPAALTDLLDEAASIEITDSGEGMSLKDLSDVYLTIGTPSRLKTRASQPAGAARPVLGEKGIGRLSAMRLGMRVRVKTTKRGEAAWNLLDLDWREFAKDPDAPLDSVRVAPTRGPAKDDPEEQGTQILITALNAPWSADQLKEVAETELNTASRVGNAPYHAASDTPGSFV